jgi:integrase
MKQKIITKNGGRKRRAAHGAGRLYKRAVGGVEYAPDSPANLPFWLAYTVNGKRIRQPLKDADGKPITDRDAAEATRKRILAPYQTGDKVDTLRAVVARLTDAETEYKRALAEADPPLRITDVWQAYTNNPERPDSGEGTLNQYQGHWNRFTLWLTTAHPDAENLDSITQAIAGEYASNLAAAGLSSNRFNKHVSFLKLLFRVLADMARIARNPFEKIKPKTLRTHSRRELTIEELRLILDRATGDLALLLYLGASTGLRLGDCATLTWGDVDLARGIIRRIPNKTARKNGKPVLVGIPAILHECLAAIPRMARTGYVLPVLAERYQRDPTLLTNAVKAHVLDSGIDVHAPGTGERIKRKPDGIPVRDETAGKVMVEDTGKPAVVDVGFHSLRHTWVSMHAAKGTPQSVIQASVGHSNPSMTAHYTHVSEDTARKVALVLPAFTGSDSKTASAAREPLPVWAVEQLQGMNVKNWKKIRSDLLEDSGA